MYILPKCYLEIANTIWYHEYNTLQLFIFIRVGT